MSFKREFVAEGNPPNAFFTIGSGTATGLAGFLVGLLSGLFIAGFFFWMGARVRP